MKQLSNIPNLVFIIIVALHVYLLLNIVFLPYPELFIYSYLNNIGLVPYKQIFDQHFPGMMFLPLNMLNLGIDTPLKAQYLHISTVVLIHFLLYLTSLKIFKSSRTVLLPNIIYLLWQPFLEGNVLWIDSIVTVFLLTSFYLLLGKSKRKYFYTGILLGISLLFKQVVAPLIILISIYVYIGEKDKNSTLKYFAGIVIPLSGLVFWLTQTGIWKDFIYWTVNFNLTVFAQMGRKQPTIYGLLKILPLFGTAAFYFLYRYFRKKLTKEEVLLGIFFFGSFFFVLARFDYIHLQPALPYAALLLSVGFVKLTRSRLKLFGLLFIAVSLWLTLPNIRFNWGKNIKFFGEYENRLSSAVLKYAQPADVVFSMGTTPHIYFLTGTRPPGNVFVFQFPWFMKVAEERIYTGLISDPPKVVVRDEKASTGGLKLVEYMPRLNEFVEKYYYQVGKVNSTEILLRK